MKLNHKTWRLIIAKDGTSNSSRNIFVVARHIDKWESLLRTHEGNYYLTSILRAIYSLNALACGRSKSMPPLTMHGASIHYELDINGDVLIHGLEIDHSIRPDNGHQTTGVYKVKYSRENLDWKTDNAKVIHFDLSEKWNNHHHAVVSGKFRSKETAGEKLIDHIKNAYRLAAEDYQKPNTHYSLYWQNDKYNSDVQRDHLVSLTQQAQSQKAPINWLVHGEGVGTFVRAMEELATYPSLSRFEAKDEEIVRNLRKSTELQRVFLSNPRGQGTRKQELEALCKKVGLTYVDTNTNNYDLSNGDARDVAFTKTVDALAKLTLGGIGAFGTSNVIKTMNLASSATSIAATTGFLLAGYIVTKGSANTLSGYARSIQNAWGSSLGDGNQKWAS